MLTRVEIRGILYKTYDNMRFWDIAIWQDFESSYTHRGMLDTMYFSKTICDIDYILSILIDSEIVSVIVFVNNIF